MSSNVLDRPHIDGFDLTQRLEEYSARLDAMTHLVKGTAEELSVAMDAFYRAQTTLDKLKLKMKTIQAEARSIQAKAMMTQSVLKALPR